MQIGLSYPGEFVVAWLMLVEYLYLDFSKIPIYVADFPLDALCDIMELTIHLRFED